MPIIFSGVHAISLRRGQVVLHWLHHYHHDYHDHHNDHHYQHYATAQQLRSVYLSLVWFSLDIIFSQLRFRVRLCKREGYNYYWWSTIK
jgi:hypothetical protein